jgi:2-polyprenyl-6-methoxyphenol hydroxylase-like FAD-dependent oxidoreductase
MTTVKGDTAAVHEVLVVGAGPTGMVLAAELKMAGAGVTLLERRPDTALLGSRALGLHSRTLEVFEQRGIADRFISQGQKAQVANFAGVPLDISDFPVRHNYGLGLPQQQTENILAGWLDELQVPVRRGVEVLGCAQNDGAATLELGDGTRMQARYVIGCDGGGSVIRKSAGIGFPGTEATTSNLIAEARFSREPSWGIRRDALGIHGIGKIGETGLARIVVTEKVVRQGNDATADELSEALVNAYGTDFGIHGITWLSRFTDMTRQAAAYRDRRVLLAGDAAHVHPPDGGMGIQTGVQDAVNLGWKLARVIRGAAPDSLLDSYHAERHPVGARMLRHTLASVALRREDERTKALRETVAELLATDQGRRHLAAVMTGFDVRYELGSVEELRDHPLLGRRMPDLDLTTDDGPTRVFALLQDARPLLLRFGSSDVEAQPWAWVKQLDARCEQEWRLPVIGQIAAPSAVLVRPDGHVAWVGGQGPARLRDALIAWFGPPG